MAQEPLLDFEALLAPIPGENPCGENLLYAGLHDRIREARRAEADLAQGDWEHEIKVADWRKVINLATEALTTKTKDLQVSAWLAEALVKIHGFAGLRDGLKLMRGTLETFWDNTYPEADEGDLEGRANALAFLDRQTAYAIREAPITSSFTGQGYSYLQWEESKSFEIPESLDGLFGDELGRVTALKEQAERENRVTGSQWRVAKNTSKRAYYEEIYALLNECTEEFGALDRVMDEKFQRQTPGLGELKKSLDDVISLVEKIVKEKRELEPDVVAGEEAAVAEEAAYGVEVGVAAGPVRSRQDALKRLAEVAEYFRKAEPHSPVSYLVQRAVAWGQMPLDRWLQDVIKDPVVLEHLRETLGLKTASEGS